MLRAGQLVSPSLRGSLHAMGQAKEIFPAGFQWHQDVHEHWGHETFWFSFLAFEPVYKRDSALKSVKAQLNEFGVRSYVIYELSGQYDMLVRAWVPNSINNYDDLIESLPQAGSTFSVEVKEIVHHWVWQQTERSNIGEMLGPAENLRIRPPIARELELLNGVQARLADSENREIELSRQERETLGDFKRRWLITEPPYESGIKFIVQVKVDERRQSLHQRQALREQICETLDEAQGIIWDRSLYFCRGHIQFILLGRVRLSTAIDPSMGQSGPFHEISPRLLDKISKIASAGGTKTYTYFFPLPGLLAFKDEVSVAPAPEHPPPHFDQLFSREESHEFEAKATAFSEVEQWLRGRGDVVTSAEPGNVAIRSVLFAVASFLNSGGGTVLLGAVEPRKFGNEERGQALPKIGKYLCLGIEHDFDAGCYDDFSRALWDVLSRRIEPDPRPWLKSSRTGPSRR
jgi:uncharacterized protein with GYD domain